MRDVAAAARFQGGLVDGGGFARHAEAGCHCVYLMMFPSGSSIRSEKGANGAEL